MHRHKLFKQTKQNKIRMRTEGGEAFLVNCGQTTDATRWHKLILGLKAG